MISCYKNSNITLDKMTTFDAAGFLFDQLDWNDIFFNKDTPFFPDPNDIVSEEQMLRSIHWDCKQIESSSSSDVEESSECDNYTKYEIRNHDCMWSGLCFNNTSNKRQRNQNSELQTKKNILDTTTDNSAKSNFQRSHQNQKQIIQKDTKETQHNNVKIVPPGTSLLLSSRINPQRRKQQQQALNFTIPNITTNDFLKERELMPIPRPDTPLSLDDDPPEFKHSVDLTACIMGSNKICLDGLSSSTIDTDKLIINKLKEQLEDTTTKNIDIQKIIPGKKNRSLSEVLNVIENENSTNLHTMTTIPKVEPDDDDDNDEEEDSEIDDIDTMPVKSSIFSSSSSSSSNEASESVAHDDHCYTRTNGAIDVVGMGLETPSDSDEEIDVVSIGDKKLPNNPSDKDRRVLQTKVANKISARIVKTANGIRTIPPRRRCSYEPYTAPVTPIKGSLSSPYPIVHPYHSISTPSTPITCNKKYSNNSRKRTAPSNKDDQQSNIKRYRGKKHKINKKHGYNILGEAETIERRNLHNDMERQRRIGLKNLFEALKKHIPSIKDKERAPKVNILREAAKYCEMLSQEEKLLIAQKHRLQLQEQKCKTQIKILQMSTIKVKEENMNI